MLASRFAQDHGEIRSRNIVRYGKTKANRQWALANFPFLLKLERSTHF